MGAIVLYTLGDKASEEAEEILKKNGTPFEIQPHLFSDSQEPVVRTSGGNLLTGMYEIRLFFPYP